MSDIVKFHDVEFEIIEVNGEKWITAKALAQGLKCGYRGLLKLIQKLTEKGELKEGVHFRFTPLPTARGLQKTTIISRRGASRISMRSEAPRAAEFRDFAEEVLDAVMTTGHYELPGVAIPTDPKVIDALARLNEGMLFLSKQMENIRFSKLIASEPDISQWPTPGQRIKRIEDLAGRKVRPYFNRGASFDKYVNQEHHKQFGGGLRMRFRRYIAKEPEFVIEPCVEMDAFLRDCYRKYTTFYFPDNQPKLRLTRKATRSRNAEVS